MKNIVALFLSFTCIIAHSATTSELTIREMRKAQICSKIHREYLSGIIRKSQFIKKLVQHYDAGNVYCALDLGEIYFKEKNYSELIPILLKESKYNLSSNDDFSSIVRMTSNFLLGEIYMYGNGALQNFDKALRYYKSASVYGDRDSFIRISQLYFNRVTMTISREDYVRSWINAYAYMKVAAALPGETKIHEHDGKTIINPFKTIAKMQELEVLKPHINEADKLASKICSNTKGCRQ